MPSAYFVSSFWESDFVSQTGLDTLVTHMKNGRTTCKEFEDYLKQRAKIEEDYGKALMKIAKVERGLNENGSLRRSLECFRAEAEAEASERLKFHGVLQEEVNKITTFREKQKEEAKKHEDLLRRTNKLKADQYRKLMSNKGNYESKCKQNEKADSDLERIKFYNKPKEVDKARKHAATCTQNMEKADAEYKSSVALLEAARVQWVREHTTACEIFEELEVERIKFLRNMIWVYSNLVSSTCVKIDESCEKNRISLESCNVDQDLQIFIKDKGRRLKPLDNITYIPYRSTPQVTNNAAMNSRPLPSVDSNESQESTYHTLDYGVLDKRGSSKPLYEALYDYEPQSHEEITLKIGDKLTVETIHDDGWSEGENKNNGQKGIFPTSYVQLI